MSAKAKYQGSKFSIINSHKCTLTVSELAAGMIDRVMCAITQARKSLVYCALPLRGHRRGWWGERTSASLESRDQNSNKGEWTHQQKETTS